MSFKSLIVGEVGQKRDGIDSSTNQPYYSATVDFMGGNQTIYFDEVSEYGAFLSLIHI